MDHNTPVQGCGITGISPGAGFESMVFDFVMKYFKELEEGNSPFKEKGIFTGKGS
jgi:hypothetical protein